MALLGRDRLPARSTLSRFLAALDQAPVEALHTVFLEDLLARPLEKEEQAGGLWDRQGTHYLVFDSHGTRQAARQRALPCTPDLPPLQRRLDEPPVASEPMPSLCRKMGSSAAQRGQACG